MPFRAREPNRLWQMDMRYVKLRRATYYLLVFAHVLSRWVPHWELLCRMDGATIFLAALAAPKTLPGGSDGPARARDSQPKRPLEKGRRSASDGELVEPYPDQPWHAGPERTPEADHSTTTDSPLTTRRTVP